MQEGQNQRRKRFQNASSRISGGIGNPRRSRIQVREENKKSDGQEECACNRGQAPRGCLPCRHVCLPRAGSWPHRENKVPARGVHSGFGQNGGITGEWRLRGG